MKHHVLSHNQQNFRRIEQATDEDRIVHDIKAAEHVSCFFIITRERRLHQPIIKIFLIKTIEDLIEINVSTPKSSSAYKTAAVTPHNADTFLNLLTQNKHSIDEMIGLID